MDSIAVRLPSSGDYVTADRLSPGMVVPSGNRAVLTTLLQFTGAGTFTTLAPTSGTRLAVVGVDVVVRNPGAGIVGGLVRISISREGNNLEGIASDTAGTYTQIAASVGIPGTAAPTHEVRDLLAGQPHVTIPYSGTNLLRVVSTLGATDPCEVLIRHFPYAAGLSCS